MATSKTIQLLRSAALYTPTAAGEGVSAKTALQNAKDALTALSGRKDGEIVLARYQETNGPIKSVLGIYHDTPDLPGTATAGWTFIQDITSSSEGLQTLQNEVDAIESNIGLGTDGSYSGYSGDGIVGTTTTLKGTVDEIIEYIKTMDLTEVGGTDGDVITTVSEADGKVSASKSSLTDVKMTGYAADSTKTGAIAATDTLEQAFNKVENAIAKNEVASADASVTITQPSSGTSSGKTDLSVNVDGTTITKTNAGALKANLTVTQLTSTEVTALSDTNVKEAYKLIYSGDSNRTAIGDIVKIYKDSSLIDVYLGHTDDTLSVQGSTYSRSTDITSGSGSEALCFVYQLADGSYSLQAVNVEAFLEESEFGNGLAVDSSTHVVSVKKDTSSGKVRTAATPSGVTPDSADDTGLVDVLTISSNGVKVDNIQAAINYAVQNASTDLAISAQGDNYITAAVDANNNKKINVTADVQSLTASAGTPGVYNATTGAQTTAPVAGTLSGTADSLADGADIATKVKTYVDGAIAIEGARSDAKNTADIKAAVEGLDGTATASSATNVDTTPSADFKVLTKVVEADGKILETTETNGSTAVTLKKVAATGAAADVSIADAGSLITATTVEGALQEIAGNVQNIGVVSNDVIVATEDTSNHNTKLSVTTGNGLEKTGTNSNTLSVKAGDGITVDSNGVAVKAGAGLVINNSSKDVDVNVGDGLEIASDAVKIKLDTTTASNNITSDMLSISSNGLMMSDTWDCGTF